MLSSDGTPRVSRRAPILVGALAVAAFLPSLLNGFVYDDERYVLKNLLIASWDWSHLRAMWLEPYFGNHHPLHLMAYALQRAAFGLEPAGWHAVSLALHALNAVLLCRLLPRFGVPAGMAVAGAALFAVHPVQAESVAWVSEQKNLLSLFFTLLALEGYLAARATGRWAPWLGASAAFLAALASKVQAVGLVPFLVAIEALRPAFLPPARGRALVRLLPFVALGGLWLNLAILAHGRAGFIHPYPGGSLATALLSDGPVLLAYLSNLLWPARLAAEYDLAHAGEMSRWALMAAWAGLGGVAWAIARTARREGKGRVALGVVWIGGFLAPVMNLVPIGPLLNDRYLYAPLCAAAPLLAAGAFALLWRAPDAAGTRVSLHAALRTALLAALVTALAVGSMARSGVWRDEMSLWTDTASRSPRSHLAHYNLGTLWLERGRDDLAEPELRAAMLADPSRPAPYKNLGVLHYRRGRYPLAATLFRAAIHLEPSSFDLWMSLGAAESGAGRIPRALASFRRASRLRPGAADPYYGIGILLERSGDREAAVRALERFLVLEPDATQKRRAAEARLRNLGLQIGNPAGVGSRGTEIAPSSHGWSGTTTRGAG